MEPRTPITAALFTLSERVSKLEIDFDTIGAEGTKEDLNNLLKDVKAIKFLVGLTTSAYVVDSLRTGGSQEEFKWFRKMITNLKTIEDGIHTSLGV